MRPSLLGAALLAVFCGCAEIAAQTAGDRAGYIEWSATRRLTIADFKGKIPSRAYESSSSWVEIEVSWECTGGEASSAATAVFDPARSWWKDISPSLWRNTDAPSLIVPRD